MASEVRIGVRVRVENESNPRELPVVRLYPAERPKIIEDYSEEPPRQFVIQNIGSAALVERSTLAPSDRLPLSRHLLAELTQADPRQSWEFLNAMQQPCLLIVRYLESH